jgi:hypothetical protein
MITSTYRNINSPELNFLNKTATVAGLDLLQFFKNQKYFIQSKFIVSNITGSKEAILDAQLAPQRYFQRPDADYIDFNPNATSLTGTYFNLGFGKTGMRGLRYSLSFYYGSPKFEINDVGYLQTTDYLADIFWIGYSLPKSKGIIKFFNINFAQWTGINNGFDYLFTGYNLNSFIQFKNLWSAGFYFEQNLPSVEKDLLRGGPSMKMPGNYFYNMYFSSKESAKVVFGMSSAFRFRDFKSHFMYNFGGWMSIRPVDLLAITFEGSYNNTFEAMQYVTTEQFDNQDRYLLSSIKQNTFNFTFRCDVNITPELTVQYYGSPFVSSVDYFDYKDITDPKNNDYNQRFILSKTGLFDFNNDGITDLDIGNNDFNFRQFRSNFVIRWDLLHGSVIYLVWSHDQTDFQEISDFNIANDLKQLFQVFPTDVLMLKIQYKFV